MKRLKRSKTATLTIEDGSARIAASTDPIFEPVSATGYVDSLGYSSAAGGWFFSGWLPRPFRLGYPDLIASLIHFDQSQFKGATMLAFYQRDDLDHSRIGVVAFVSGSSRAVGNLRCVSFALDGIEYQLHAGHSTAHLSDQEIVDNVRVTLVNQAFANKNREHLLSISSRPRFAGQDTLSSLSEPVLLEIDEAILCPPGDLVLRGWQLSLPGTIRSIRIRSGSLVAQFNLDESIAVSRVDVIDAVGLQYGFSDPNCGFIGFVSAAISTGDLSYLEVELENGEIGFKCLRLSKRSGMSAIRQILEGINVRYGEVGPAFDKTIGPAIQALNAARLEKPVGADALAFGVQVEKPAYSLIIPLYGRIDFIEYQMAVFSQHNGIRHAEIIYILDDPPKRRELESLAHSVYERFRVPFRLLLLGSNLGFAPANNVGLRHARGEYICFLNSDIFPITTDWMEKLIELLRSNPRIGVIGPRLLFEDGSVQHDGCYFRPIEEFGNWMFVEHQNKGRRPAASGGLRIYDVITGACMAMRRELASELKGFDESFIIGDFEDADLCMKVRQKDLFCAVTEDLQLYHLERKSQTGPEQNWRMNLTLYNAWVHQRRWFSAGAPTTLLLDGRT